MRKLLYHYTSIDNLYNILKPNEEGLISIRATHASFMNDPLEYNYAISVIKDSMIKYEDKNNIKERKSTHFFSGETDFFTSIAFGSGEPFILSFSEQQNDLSMWRAYGKDGTGVSIGFDFDELNKYANKSSIGKLIGFVKCAYDKEATFEAMIEIWGEIYDNFLIYDNRPALKLSNSLLPWIIIIKLCFMAKQNFYKTEKEWRLCTSNSKDYEIKVRNNILVPFIKHLFPKEIIKQIVIGPCLDKTQSKKGLEMFLNKYEYKIDSIIESDISYRQV